MNAAIVAWIILGCVIVQRLAEFFYSEQNARRLLARGALEVGRSHYLFVVVHIAWFIALAITLYVQTNHGGSLVMNWWLIGVFALIQLSRVWVIRTLGAYWTMRIITLPNAPLVRSGAYRFVRHPNYILVIGEVTVLPLAFGEIAIAIIFMLIEAALVAYRIYQEDRALAPRQKV